MTTTAESTTAPTPEPPGLYVSSGHKVGYETYTWGQPPAAHYVLTVKDHSVLGADRGLSVSSGAGYAQPSDLELEEELREWQAARDEVFLALEFDV